MKKDNVKIEIKTVMFIDIVNYTKRTTYSSRDRINEMHDVFDNISLPIFENYSGKVIKKIGDAFLVTFSSATDAVFCGVELQKSFLSYNQNKPKQKRLMIRVALHMGEVILRHNDIYGDAVNAASRIESIAKPGHVVFSSSVYNAMNKNEIPVTFIGTKRFKGLRYPVKLFKVKSQYDKIIKKRKRNRKESMKIKRIISVFFYVLFLVLLAIGLVYFISKMLV